MTPTPASVVQGWADESLDYDHCSDSCSGVCGHYTQVVWASTLRVGYALRSCSVNSPFGAGRPEWAIVVCEYSPPGNWVGQRAYSASSCPG